MNFKLRQLQGLLALARAGSFSRAAAATAMTQPAFSQMIRELEATLDVRLFDRTTRRVDLTEAGRTLVGLVQRPVDELEDAWLDLRGFATGTRGRIALALLPSAAFGFVTRALAAYRTLNPLVQVTLREEQNDVLLQKVRDREVDFGIGILAASDPDLQASDLFVDELVAVLASGHRLAARSVLSWKALASEPLILLPRPSSVRQLVEASLARKHAACEPAFEVANMLTAASMARSGLGITVLPWLALAEMRQDGLDIRRIGAPRPLRRVSIVRRRDRRPGPAAQAFLALLEEGRTRFLPQAPHTPGL
jgi:LysR family transcriptional regulator, carnitine catabolism transcriptional activator